MHVHVLNSNFLSTSKFIFVSILFPNHSYLLFPCLDWKEKRKSEKGARDERYIRSSLYLFRPTVETWKNVKALYMFAYKNEDNRKTTKNNLNYIPLNHLSNLSHFLRYHDLLSISLTSSSIDLRCGIRLQDTCKHWKHL